MSKRRPTSDLNHENWNQEEEPEEAGTFQVASQTQLQNRKILRPKRKLTEGAEPTSNNPFQGFGSFSFPVLPPPVIATSVQPDTVSSEGTPEIPSSVVPSEDETDNVKQKENGNSNEAEAEHLEKSIVGEASDSPVKNVSENSVKLESEPDTTSGLSPVPPPNTTIRDGGVGTTQEEEDLPDFVDHSDDEDDSNQPTKLESDSETENLLLEKD